MATTYNADNYGVPMPSFPGVGVPVVREFLFTNSVAFVVNDVVQLCRIPGLGSPLVLDNFFMDIPDLDSGGAPTFACSVGDGATPGKFVAIQTAIGQGPGKFDLRTNGVAACMPVSYSANENLVFKVTTVAQTAPTGGVIKGWLMYHYIGAPTPV